MTKANKTGVSNGATRDRGVRTVSARRRNVSVGTTLTRRTRGGRARTLTGSAVVVIGFLSGGVGGHATAG